MLFLVFLFKLSNKRFFLNLNPLKTILIMVLAFNLLEYFKKNYLTIFLRENVYFNPLLNIN